MSEGTSGKMTMSFWRLLSRYAIQIPAIQRDYVQGRGDKQSTSARTIMLNDIQNHIARNKPMSLNFIYGKVIQDDDVDMKLFIPLDGQQRLTTLYLIHWLALVVAVANEPNGNYVSSLDNTAKILGKFSYQTRQTSTDFFARMSENDIIKQVAQWMNNRYPQNTLSEYLQDKYWFRPDFMFDPTIVSALRVLDDIDGRGITQQSSLWDILTNDDCPIRFAWLDVNDIGNGDDLYIKMNARGKQLSDFENIKAELEQKAQALFPTDHYEVFCLKFDQEWTDFFWSFKGTVPIEKRDEYDMRFMSFLNWFLWNQWASRATTSSRVSTDYSMNDIDLSDTRHRGLDAYDKDLELGERSVYDKQTLIRLERILNYVSGDNAIPEISEIVKASSPADGKTDYNTRMRLEAATAYLDSTIGQGRQPDQQSWNTWIRIIQHLSDAATTWQGYNTLGLYARAVGMVEQYAKNAEDLTTYLATLPGITGFTPKDQIDEEELKAWLLTNAPQWTESLHKAEAIPYFKGKIGFLLDFAGISKDNIEDSSQNPNVLATFDKYLALTNICFNRQDTNSVDKELLIDVRRALLTKGDYSIKEGRNSSYLVDEGSHARTLGWRNLLRTSPEKSELLHKLYDDILNRIDSKQLNRQIVVGALTAIANEYVWDGKRTDAYAKPLIQHKGLWSADYFGSLWQFRVEDGICYLPSGEKTQLNGSNHELNSCVICEGLKHDVPTLHYTLRTRVGRLYREWKPSEPNYLTLQRAGTTVHVGMEYVLLDGSFGYTTTAVIIVSHNEQVEYFSDTDEATSYIKDIFA